MSCVGFEAIAAADARVLILGTLPSVASLQRGEYYAHPRNSFWWIMGKLIGAVPEMAYQDRARRLKGSGIALWDVCRVAEREGSSDAKILLKTVDPNDFHAFFGDHPQIRRICFNGQPAERLFRRLVLPTLSTAAAIPRQVLDSTSPACARISREEKLLRWRNCLTPFIGAELQNRK